MATGCNFLRGSHGPARLLASRASADGLVARPGSNHRDARAHGVVPIVDASAGGDKLQSFGRARHLKGKPNVIDATRVKPVRLAAVEEVLDPSNCWNDVGDDEGLGAQPFRSAFSAN